MRRAFTPIKVGGYVLSLCSMVVDRVVALVSSALPYADLGLTCFAPTVHRVYVPSGMEVVETQVEIMLFDFRNSFLQIRVRREPTRLAIYTVKARLRVKLASGQMASKPDIKARLSAALSSIGIARPSLRLSAVEEQLDQIEGAKTVDELLTLIPDEERDVLKQAIESGECDLPRAKAIAKAMLFERATSFSSSVRLVAGTVYHDDGGERPLLELRCDLQATGALDDDLMQGIAREILSWLMIAYALREGEQNA